MSYVIIYPKENDINNQLYLECFKRFFGLQSSLGITNVNRSHNKPLELIETI